MCKLTILWYRTPTENMGKRRRSKTTTKHLLIPAPHPTVHRGTPNETNKGIPPRRQAATRLFSKSFDPNQFNSQVPITGITSQTAQIALDRSANWFRCRNAASGELNSNNPLQISPHFMRDLASTEQEESQHRKKSAGRIQSQQEKKGADRSDQLTTHEEPYNSRIQTNHK
jgi:hypothetical protein